MATLESNEGGLVSFIQAIDRVGGGEKSGGHCLLDIFSVSKVYYHLVPTQPTYPIKKTAVTSSKAPEISQFMA